MATARKATGKSTTKKSVAAKSAKSTSQIRTSVATTKSKKSVAKRAVKKAAAKSTMTKSVSRPAVKKPVVKQSTAKRPVASRSGSKKVTKGPTAKKPVKSKLGKKFVDEMKARLLEERAKYLQTAEDLRAEADSLFADREPGDVQFDEESGEGDTLAVERERGLALSSQAASAVQQIDDALSRIVAGTYGICITSGLPIPKDRLDAIPWAAERVEIKVGGLTRR